MTMRRSQAMMPMTILLVCLMTMLGIMPRSNAGFEPSASLDVPGRAADMAVIQATLEQEAVRHRLDELGYSAEEIDSRLARLSDADLHQMAQDLEQVQASGSSGAIAVILVIAIIAAALAIFTFFGLDEKFNQ